MIGKVKLVLMAGNGEKGILISFPKKAGLISFGGVKTCIYPD
ncbi:MAG: hypothetical protein NTV31_16205 [Bacteroidia bacterium]|nr:hypothetical protein [Bacteroidia bacterium]